MFLLTFGKGAPTVTHPSKVKPEGYQPVVYEGAADRQDQAVVHIPAKEGMGMADYHAGERTGKPSRGANDPIKGHPFALESNRCLEHVLSFHIRSHAGVWQGLLLE